MSRAAIAFVVTLVAVLAGSARAQSLVVVGEPGVSEERIAAAVAALREREFQVIELVPGSVAAAAREHEITASVAAVSTGLEDARARYIALELDQAIADLEKIEAEEAATLLGDPRGVAVLAELNLWLGNLLVAARRRPDAELRFAQAIALRADLEIDRARFPPEVTRVFARVKQRAPAKTSSLTVDSRPAGATVTVDGDRRREPTPVTVAAAGGWHYVGLELAGFRPWAQRIEMPAGQVKPLPVALTPGGRDRVSADVAALMSERYASDPARTVVAVAWAVRSLSAEGHLPPMAGGRGPALEVVVIGATSISRYRDDGQRVATASGGDVAVATGTLFVTESKPDHDRSRPVYKKWWFWTAVGGAVVTSAVLIYAVTEDDTLRGRFTLP